MKHYMSPEITYLMVAVKDVLSASGILGAENDGIPNRVSFNDMKNK